MRRPLRINQKFITRHYRLRHGAGHRHDRRYHRAGELVERYDDQRSRCPAPALVRRVEPVLQQARMRLRSCGELVITAANGKKSIDTVTVTGGTAPTT